MQFSTKAADPAAVGSGCIVAGIFQGRELSAAAKAIERASKGYLSRILGQLSAAGLIRVRGRNVEIPDTARLRDWSGRS